MDNARNANSKPKGLKDHSESDPSPLKQPGDNTTIRKTEGHIVTPNDGENPVSVKDEHRKRGGIIKRRYNIRTIDRLMVTCNILMLVAFIVTSWIQGCQTQKSNGLTSQSLLLTQKAIDLTASADSISKESLRLSIASARSDSIMTIKDTLARDRNTKMELRAYIVIDSIGFPSKKIGERMPVYLHFKNAGRTPAYNIKFRFSDIITADSVLTKHEVDSLIRIATNVPVGFWGPGQGFRNTHKTKMVITDKTWKDMWSGRNTLYLITRVEYEDIFKENHFVDFCLYTNVFHQQFMVYKKYNDAN